MTQKQRVGIVYGGKSGEHEVSLQTARAVINAFDKDKYEISPIYITKEGEWRMGNQLPDVIEDVDQLSFSRETSKSGLATLFGHLNDRQEQPVVSLHAVDAEISSPQSAPPHFDVMLPLLHGTNGEDGTIQGLFEMANVPYVGAGVLASAVGMDKVLMKKVFAQAGLPQCIYRHFAASEWEKNQAYLVMDMEVSIGYPCFIKPANLGSSVGISKARNREELIEGVAYALRFDRKVVVEEFVDAREIEVAVLGNEEPEASVAGEIVSSSDFYDYKAKYVDGTSAMIIPAEIEPDVSEQIRDMARTAFRAIDGSGLSRVDFFMRKDDGALFINEINTMPGFTPYSMYPLLWKESGLAYPELLDRLIQLALERYNGKQKLSFGMES
ncbi:D-alanine--D-alanine ligase [Marinicrinis sediminis]|uniref:D-alanine--D-alanine ligase n=1 Tax=Marinicrinis sediminis TaxID=1652465 RepID=A0ABW5RER1_9BACL